MARLAGIVGALIAVSMLTPVGALKAGHGIHADKGTYPMLHVPVVIVRVDNPHALAPPAPLDAIEADAQAASAFWEQYRIRMRVTDKITVQRPSWLDMGVGFGGQGEVNDAINELAGAHPNKVVILAVKGLEDELPFTTRSTMGGTEW